MEAAAIEWNPPSVDEIEALVASEYKDAYQVRNIYIFGSRLYGCHSEASDWDIMAVVDGEYFYSSHLLEGRQGDIQLSIYHRQYWEEIIQGNFITGLLVCFSPPKFRLKEDILFPVSIKVPTLQRTVRMDSSHNYNKGRRLFKEGDIYTAKKNFVHGLRYLLFAFQLIEHGQIVDFSAGNAYWSSIMADPSTDVRHYETSLWPIYEAHTLQLKSYGLSKTILELNTIQAPVVTPLAIRQLGLGAIERELAVFIRRDRAFPNLVHLTHDLSSPLTERVAQECSGLILDEEDEWKVISMPFLKMFSTTSNPEVLANFDVTGCSISEMLDGKMACLYHYRGEWRIGTKWTSDGSEALGSVNLTKYADWQNFVSHNTANFSAVHPNKGSIQILPGDKANGTVAHKFWEIWGRLHMKLPEQTDCCFIFELVTPEEINVVEHTESTLTLIGCRSLDTLQEIDPREVSARYGWSCVRFYELDSAQQTMTYIESQVRQLDPIKQAGFVLCNASLRRIQVRSPGFHALEKLHPMNDGNMNKKLIFDLVRTNEHRSWTKLEKYSHWVSLFQKTNEQYERFCRAMEAIYCPIKEAWGPGKRGIFAAALKSQPPLVRGLIFEMMDLECQISVREKIATMEPMWRIFKVMAQWEEGQGSAS